MTMPIRVQSWDTSRGLAPIFDMNLPEGALRERLLRRFAKATGAFDELELLTIVGRSQIGRLRYTGMNEHLGQAMPFQALDEILRARRDGGLFEHLLEQFAAHSGISGVQPKVMIRSGDGKLSPSAGRQSATVQSTTHILKLWDADEYPHLAANEFFCLEAARRLGLPVPTALLSDDGGALIVERFDLATERYLGFEDFCVLNGLQSRDKYRGSYETRLWKRLRDFVPVEDFAAQAEQLFRLFVLNCCLRNGDAHLKNFGLLYDEVDSAARLAPVYDLVTTTAYLPADRMALTLDGSTEWPDAKRLTRLGQVRAELSSKSVRLVFEAVSDAVADTRPAMVAYFAGADAALGARVAAAWNQGLQAMSER
jgi:serine/threonine-protein kinase HipA